MPPTSKQECKGKEHDCGGDVGYKGFEESQFSYFADSVPHTTYGPAVEAWVNAMSEGFGDEPEVSRNEQKWCCQGDVISLLVGARSSCY